MSISKRSVHVFQVPSTASERESKAFLRELSSHVENGRPRFVLDCSQVAKMNDDMVHLLLCSLEEVMKVNGDIRLAALSLHAETVVDRSGISRIFETFKSVDSAVQSYQRAASLTPRRFARTSQTGQIERAA